MNFTFDPTISLGLIVTGLGTLVGWVRLQFKSVNTSIETLGKRLDQRIDAQGERLDRHDNRISVSEQTLTNLPGQADMHAVALSISEMRGEVREVKAQLSGTNQIMTRLESIVTRQEDHLMSRAGK